MVNEVFARKRSKAARVVEGMHKGSVLIGGMDGLGQQAGRRNGASGQGRSEEAKREERGQSRCVKRRVVIRGDRSGADGR
jgi:hypothetical protein